MKRLAALLLQPLLVLAQATSPTESANSTSDFTLHINVNLVQVDAVVTDSKDRPVTDLKADDFAILQDGKSQPITNFSYIKVAEIPEPVQNHKEVNTKTAVPVPPRILKLKDVHRVVSLVVDDLGLSFESIATVHEALKKFVDQQMQPQDLVAIIRTGAGVGALQQFTSDKRLLYAAIDRVKFNPMGRGGISSFAPRESISNTNPSLAGNGGTGQAQYGNMADSAPQSQYGQLAPSEYGGLNGENSLQEMYSAGTLGAVRFVVEGLRYVPGRKSIILFSENMQMSNAPLVVEGLRRLTDAAERASVIIYTVDPRGLPTLEPNAADETSGMSSAQLTSMSTDRSIEYRDSQEGLAYLARETGGLFLHDSNDLPGEVRHVMADSSGYYLIGYHPVPGTFDPVTGERKFHSLKIVVKTPGLHVRTREGFFGFEDTDPKILERPENQMAHALAMPFSASDIHLRLTTLFFNGDKGPYIRSLLYVDAHDLTFAKDPDGTYTAQVGLLSGLFGDNGQIIASSDRSRTLHIPSAQYDAVMKNGFILGDQLAIKKAGPYQMRIVLRDGGTKKLGSANQFIEIPELKKKHLTLSSILLKEYSSEDMSPGNGPVEREAPATDSKGNVAVRIFKPGAKITYAYEVLNAEGERNQIPQVIAQVKLFRDGKQFFEGHPTPLDFGGQRDIQRPTAGGVIQLGPQFAPGDYILQVVVTDSLNPKSKRRTAAQWMDFEVQ